MITLNFSTILFLIILVSVLFFVVYLIGKLQGQKKSTTTDLPPNLIALYQEVQNLPAKILNTIQGSINPQKGKVAELLTYAELRYDYDVIIPLGRPIDFIGIKNGVGIDFIEVKSSLNKSTNNSYTLTPEEKEIQRLVRLGNVNFRLVIVKDEVFKESN